jgi:hypothetical protein
MGEPATPYKALVVKSHGTAPWRTRQRWKDNNNINLRGKGCEDLNWIVNFQHRIQQQASAGNFFISCITISRFRKTLYH